MGQQTLSTPDSGTPARAVPRDLRGPILFTGFEPSGDDHASAVIAELRARHPDLKMFAWGGPKMERAGATIVERTGDNAVMGMPGLDKIMEHRRINRRVEAWLRANPVALHVPVDSPAANFPICAIARRHGARVVHLVAPQVWAWGQWRIGKLRRLSNHVLCLLPFEQAWFLERDVRATFVGHPLFDHPLDEAALDASVRTYPTGDAKLALMPGSRPAEIRKNFPLLLATFRTLRRERPGLVGVVAVTGEPVERTIRAIAQSTGGWPDGLHVAVRETDAVVRWCEVALVVSGTVTLQIARQRRPMAIVYKSSPLFYMLLARWLLTTEFLTLPNLVAGRQIVPEMVPHFGDERDLLREVRVLLDDPRVRERQSEALGEVCAKFAGHNAARASADAIEDMLVEIEREASGAPARSPAQA
ncbi:MAG: hypothetical protein RBS39_00415 [Phycisphaerales bacterium]|nr:hypothetical protein [Phycisphaerales bacterium]